MADMGFDQLFTDQENPEGCLLTSFIYPDNPLFIFEEFYQRLADAGKLKFLSTMLLIFVDFAFMFCQFYKQFLSILQSLL